MKRTTRIFTKPIRNQYGAKTGWVAIFGLAHIQNNKVIGAWAIGIGLATVFAIITAIAGAEAEVIWGQFVVWPFLVFMLLEVDKPKK